MKRTGPPPTPTHLRLLQGNPGKRALNKNEAHPTAGIPPCPRHLDTVARKEWRTISKQLVELGLLSTIDKAALAGYCVAWAEWIEAVDRLGREGKVFKRANGNPLLSPWWTIANEANKTMYRYLTEFGLTPAARSRIHAAPPKKPESKLSKFTDSRTA